MEETTRRRTVFRSCSLCEAMCGLRFEVEDDRIVSVRPDDDDVFSHGYVCPKGIAYADIHHDPDRLRSPMRRQADGTFAAISWPEALDLVATRLREVRARHGADAVAVYFGNPAAHDHGAIAMRDGFMRTLGTRNSYGASSQDTNPRFATSYYLYGSSFVIPVPDVDRTAYLLCLGGNPLVSQGSFACAPNMRARLRGIRARGGRVVVVDPRRSETAREADEHVAIRPGGDAALLLAMVQVLVARGRVDRERLERVTTGWEAIERRLAAFTPERAARYAGVPAQTIERLALEFADAPSATAYSRIGVCNSAFGTLGTYATDLLNLVAGRLGEVGGAMFPTPAFDVARLAYVAGMDGHARWQTRVRGLPETIGDLPAAALAEEIETPGAGQIRALVTIAGNPALSVPNGRRLAAALPTLDFMVALDFYVTETSRHADVILPPASTLTGDHVDVLLYSWTVRNVARWSPPVVARRPEERADWEILLEIAYRLGGGPTGRRWADRLFRAARRFGVHWNPTAFVTLMLRTGPYGDRFLPGSRGLNMRKLRQAPHGVDLGPLEPGLARRVLHRDRRVRLAPEPILRAMDGLARTLERPPQETPLLLIGRRQLRSNNSWMHNVASLVSGRERCVLLVHPEDAARAGVADGGTAILESRTYRGELPVRVSDEMRPGVVSLPHGWGHAASAPWQRVAGEHAGVSANDWTDESEVESVVGQSILNGVPVSLRAVAAEKRA